MREERYEYVVPRNKSRSCMYLLSVFESVFDDVVVVVVVVVGVGG